MPIEKPQATVPPLIAKYGVGEPGQVLRFYGDGPMWMRREGTFANVWVQLSDGQAGVLFYRTDLVARQAIHLYGLVSESAKGYPETAYYLGPFDPLRPDLDPPEARSGIA